jgi:hypothetical protein
MGGGGGRVDSPTLQKGGELNFVAHAIDSRRIGLIASLSKIKEDENHPKQDSYTRGRIVLLFRN